MTKNLIEYNQKRDFSKTLEPEGKVEASHEGLAFVVQHHIARKEHFDLRLEWNDVLLSWAVPKGPSFNNHDKRLAVQVEDHPLEYRNFEGTIPKGEYGGGVVMIWDEGFWEPYGNVEEGLNEGGLKFSLNGRRLKGNWALIRLKANAKDAKNNWLLIKEKDEYAKNHTGISEFTTSVRTGRKMEEIETEIEKQIPKNPFNRVDVQLAKLVNTVPSGQDWLYEMKYDGYRIIAFIENNLVRLISRNSNDYTKKFPEATVSLANLAAGRSMVLDGEMTVVNASGKTDFQALQSYIKKHDSKNLTYIVFDILALDGKDLRERRLIDRKEILEALMKDAPKGLYYSRHVRGNGNESFDAACQAGMEGIVGKKYDSIYSGTRNGDWIKLKCDRRQEFLIGGYTASNKKTSGISSLLLGTYDGENLVYVGRAGTGLNKQIIKELNDRFKLLRIEKSPFIPPPEQRSNEKIIWLKPELIAEIKFAEWTEESMLRQASFKGLIGSKDPKDINVVSETADIKKTEIDTKAQQQSTIDEPDRPIDIKTQQKSIADEPDKPIDDIIRGIKITSPDKVIFSEPEITKADVIRYYEKVSEHMLPYISNRIISSLRCPNGISQDCFYKKHPDIKSMGVINIPISTSNGETEDYFYIKDISGLIYEAQMGTLEFHIWGSRVEELEKPDIMVFDLDPDEGMELSRVRQGVKDIKSILLELSLKSYLKTSGGKGYHVVVPLIPSASWDVFRNFSRRVVEVMEQKWPDRYTSNVRKIRRTDKIFIDWIRNGRGATSVAPYSLRARKGAKISMPIAWDELNTIDPDGVDIADALTRISGDDPWKDFFNNNQMLK